MQCIAMSGSDNRMDCQEMFWDPLNPLPVACGDCGFPNLDHVPQPYFLVRSRTNTPNEMALAEVGNLLVRERVQRVLEFVAPDAFRFYPTCYRNTSERTPWQLAVPVNQVETAEVNQKITRCKTCGECRSAHPGTQYKRWTWDKESEHHAVKSATWASSENGWDRWIDREVYLSRRLYGLLKEVGVKGLQPSDKVPPLEKEEKEFIAAQLNRLAEEAIPRHAPGTLNDEDTKWLRKHIKDHAAQPVLSVDWKSIEKQKGVKLPKSYKDYLGKVGPGTFENVDEQAGFTARLVSPLDLDAESYRAGRIESYDEESNAVDGVMFAGTDHGDCFCFDVRKDRKEYAVFLYLHEGNCFEPYAENFATCLRRFIDSPEH